MSGPLSITAAWLCGGAGLFALLVWIPRSVFRWVSLRFPSDALWASLLAILLACLVTAGLLHHGGIPLTTRNLGLAFLAEALLASWTLARRSPRPTGQPIPPAPFPNAPAWFWFVLIASVLPVTPLAGIDTYKWQDLASSMAVEGRLAWLTSPAAWLGGAARAYPPLQPVALGTFQLLAPWLGVEGGFATLSVVCALLTAAAADALARRLWSDPARRFLFVSFYSLAPVAVRYLHWTTGRGVFLAVLPLFILGLFRWRTRFGLVALTGAALLLLLSHRAALVMVPATLLAAILGAWMPRRLWPLLLLAGGALALLLSEPWGAPAPWGFLPGLVRTLGSRFGLAVLLAAPGLWALGRRRASEAWRVAPPTLLLLWPLAAMSDPYAAMGCLPWMAILAVAGLGAILPNDGLGRPPRIVNVVLGVVAVLALSVSAVRSIEAMPWRLRHAARFLDRMDPRGPLVLEAPGMARRWMQAYLGGCPRFSDAPPAHSPSPRLQDWQWPDRSRPLRAYAVECLRAIRRVVQPPADGFAWYGDQPRRYYVRVDGAGALPPVPVRLYSRDGIELHAPAGQIVPPRESP